MVRITDIDVSVIYNDLLRKFRNEGHEVYVVTPCERRLGMKTSLTESKGARILSVRTLNLQKTNFIEKGIGQVLVERQYRKAIQHYLKDVKFDLILYSTPPITFPNVIAYLKRENPLAKSYLLLKDIFPQNAVDLGMLTGKPVQGSWFKVHGWVARGKYQLYKYFRRKEKKLYALSDYIGCMSPANVEYLLKHNPDIAPSRVEVAPNSVELNLNDHHNTDEGQVKAERYYIRKKYDLPTDKPILIYGGNLGKPQGIPFLIECLNANSCRSDCYFVVVGTGTELPKLKTWYDNLKSNLILNDININVKVMNGLPKADYDLLVKHCDVGLIFLDHRFTIPNYPSRLLSYLENKMPVLCATDPNTDMGRIAEENGYGYWCESNSVEAFTAILDKMIKADRKAMGEKGYLFLKENYLVEHTYSAIMKHFDEK